MAINLKLLISGFCSVAFVSQAFAAPVSQPLEDSLPQCNTLIKQCFAHAGLERANCFCSAGTHPFCDGSSLGELILKRWEMAPNRPAGAEGAPGFMGPKLVDQECLRKFDNTLSSQLLKEEVPAATVEQLSESIEQCYETMPLELVRP